MNYGRITMRDKVKISLKYLPLVVGCLILFVGSLFIPWKEVFPYLTKLSPATYIFIIVIGVVYYLARIIRYHYMLGVLNVPRPFRQTLLAYFVAQPATLVPGGDIYKTVTLKKHASIQFDHGVSVVFLQSYTESVGLVLLALISSLWLSQYALIIWVVMIIYIAVLVLVRTRRLASRQHKLINKIPLVNVTRQKIITFIDKNKTLLRGKSLAVLLITGMIPPLLASFLLLIVARDIGIQLSFYEAVIALSIPGVLQNISFLPGGLGINEQSSVGILVLFGATLASAVALTIVIRLVTLGLGIVLGVFATIYTKVVDNKTA